MSDNKRKILTACAIAAAFIIFPPYRTFAEAQTPAEKILQPQGLNHTGIYAIQQLDPNLTGFGVKFAVICRSNTYIDGQPQNDYRPDISHNCFNSNQITFHDQETPAPATSPHSTAACSILFGSDPNAYNEQLGDLNYQGAAPQAKADVYEFWYFLINNIFPQLPPDGDIITASFGSPFDDWWTRGIESLADKYGLTVVASIGNGSDAHDSTLYPAAGSNVIGVGVVDSVESLNPVINLTNFALAWPEHSSCGPTGDSRVKPDIVAPGNCLAADETSPDNYEPAGNWSSFSTSVVAGAAGLLVQKAKQTQGLYTAVSPQGSNCVIKAILLNSAKKLPYWHKGQLSKDDDHLVPLDYAQGAGLLDALSAYKHLVAGFAKPGKVNAIGWDNSILDSNKNIYDISIPEPDGKLIVVTAAWNKHFSEIYPFEPLPEKNMDLRLELWAVDKNNQQHLLDYSDSANDNLEHIYFPADANYTDYKITVAFSPNNIAPTSERYALAWNVAASPDKNSIVWYDLNSDGIVNNSDFDILVDNMLASVRSPDSYCFGDINGDGSIDGADIKLLLNHFNTKADWYAK
jgi:hypothetical protein